MTRKEAIELFGSVRKLAEALGVSVQAIYAWPEELDQKRADWTIGAAVRLGIK